MKGTVVEFGAGPVAGATVSARSCDDTPAYNHVFSQTVTDMAGAFRLTFDSGSDFPVGCVYLRAEKSGYVRGFEEEPRWNGDKADITRENITLNLQRLRGVAGRVIEVESGGPVRGVELLTGGSAGNSAFSDANGFFVVSGVGNTLYLRRNGFVQRTVHVPEGQDADLGDVRLQRAIDIAAGGRLTSQVSSGDVYYDDFFVMWDDGIFCSPCKSINLQTGEQDVELRLQWSGDIPLAIWAWAGGYDEMRARATQGQSTLVFRVPPATQILLVGVASSAPGQQSVEQPVPFELATNPVPK